MSYGAAIDELTASPAERGIAVVVEAYTRDQIAGVAEDARLKGNYKKETLSSNQINLKRYGAGGANSFEGFLFPATYELKPSSSAEDLVDQQLKAFERNFKQVDLKYARSKNLSPYDVLIIASMIDHGAGPARAQPRRGGDLQPAGCERGAGNRRDDPVRDRKLRQAAHRVGALDRLAVLADSSRGCRRPRSTRARRNRGRRRPRRGDNRWFVVKPVPAASTSSLTPRRSSTRRRIATSGRSSAGANRRRSARRRPPPPRGARAPDRALALAGDPQRGVRGARDRGQWSYERSTTPRRSSPSASGRCERGLRGRNVTVPHKHAALALADTASDRR